MRWLDEGVKLITVKLNEDYASSFATDTHVWYDLLREGVWKVSQTVVTRAAILGCIDKSRGLDSIHPRIPQVLKHETADLSTKTLN